MVAGRSVPGRRLNVAKSAARKAPTMKEYCTTFMEEGYRNKPGTQRSYQSVIGRYIIPILGRMNVQDEKRPDGTNPCRHVPMSQPGKEARLIVGDERVRIFRQ